MNKILDKEEVEKFIKENKVKGYSIIIKINNKEKLASYVIDGKKEISINYEDALKYFN